MFSDVVEMMAHDTWGAVIVYSVFAVIAVVILLWSIIKSPDTIEEKRKRVRWGFRFIVPLLFVFMALSKHDSILPEALRLSGTFGFIVCGKLWWLTWITEIISITICSWFYTKTDDPVKKTALREILLVLLLLFFIPIYVPADTHWGLHITYCIYRTFSETEGLFFKLLQKDK